MELGETFYNMILLRVMVCKPGIVLVSLFIMGAGDLRQKVSFNLHWEEE